MGTRSEIQFRQQGQKIQVYCSMDGYPDYKLDELSKFLKWSENRIDDLSYLSANFITWYKISSAQITHNDKTLEQVFEMGDKFGGMTTGIGIVDATEEFSRGSGIEWFYIVDLDKKTVKVYSPSTLRHTVNFEDLASFAKKLGAVA